MTTIPAPTALTTNRRVNPIGIDSTIPEFGWQSESGQAQSGYEIEVFADNGTAVWLSGFIAGTEPFGVAYRGESLVSRQRYIWRVRVTLEGGEQSVWSRSATFETGILDASEWSALWVTDSDPEPQKTLRSLYFRAETELRGDVRRARAYASALGWYKLFINGTDVTGDALVPRFTPFDDYVEYQAYDVTDLLKSGSNILAAAVGDGRFRGRNGYKSTGVIYGDRLALIVQIHVEFTDGTEAVLSTDRNWVVGGGPILTADPKTGERVDLRISTTDWLQPGGAPINATPVRQLPAHRRVLVAEELERVTLVSTRRGTISRTPSGVQIVDFGQNFSGIARIRLKGYSGQSVRLSYGEVLTPQGEFDEHYLDFPTKTKEWFQRDEVTLPAGSVDYTPWFTFKGFRYLAVQPAEGDVVIEDVQGLVYTSDIAAAAQFETSDPRLNQLWSNIEWSLRSNFLDVPMDCPTRERSGYTGDLQVFGKTAAVMVDSDNYIRRFLRNLEADQYEDGGVPAYAPREWSDFRREREPLRNWGPVTGWGDATTILPMVLHEYYGDIEVLRRQYASARAWVEYLREFAATKKGLVRRFGHRFGVHEKYIVDHGRQVGEWLRPGTNIITESIATMIRPPAEVATAYLAYSAKLLSAMAELIGNGPDVKRFEAIATEVRAAYRAAFVRSSGRRIGADMQDDYVRALAFDLLAPHERAGALGRLVELVQKADYHLGTGFLSTPMLLPVLCDNGRPDIAYRLLMQTTVPSWLAEVDMGATTVWETWEGYKKNGNAFMSHNHYAFGSVASWLVEYVLGIRPLEAGYRRILFAPTPGGGLARAAGSVTTPYGQASSNWSIDDGVVSLNVTVPNGTSAEVRLGDGTAHEVGAGDHQFTWPVNAVLTRV
ncbi:family 78 glycoside hydrolase catalytic domain [Arthrobacter sp. MMS18-M83]|uniref:family 78 glycoside hydrolase catalytic domain n=1 Tax=Arthrobacter sp. MMS18-M83 TaxID=2996261 RepID=UPI00227B872F|nr:family 78 glycoside hydrolase catalytic domain [Arthrobacter sp. MMS18-M83]WAH97328.1 family 78 glycoside hydrolase catalytic domain [Arthrobacter sp. MMS18-M83]